jgi:hypothetical protein
LTSVPSSCGKPFRVLLIFVAYIDHYIVCRLFPKVSCAYWSSISIHFSMLEANFLWFLGVLYLYTWDKEKLLSYPSILTFFCLPEIIFHNTPLYSVSLRHSLCIHIKLSYWYTVSFCPVCMSIFLSIMSANNETRAINEVNREQVIWLQQVSVG